MSISDKWIEEATQCMATNQSAWLLDAEQTFTRLNTGATTSAAESDVKAWQESCKGGAFQDIEYPQQQAGHNTAPLYEHLHRVHSLASVGIQQSKDIYTACAVEALVFFTQQAYATTNWWHINIGLARSIGRCLIVLAGARQAPAECLAYVQNISNVDLDMSGANQTDLASNQLLWAFAGWKATADLDYLKHAYAASKEISRCCEFAYLRKPSWGEGMRVDYSYSAHNPYATKEKNSVCSQLYAGSYGAEFLRGVFHACSMLSGVFSLASESLEKLELHMTEGLAWCAYAGSYDFHTRGRVISRKGEGGTGSWTRWIDLLLPTAKKPERLRELRKLATGEVLTTPGYRGSRAFWTNDFLSHIDDDFAVFCKVISKRTVGTETGNGENLKGYYMGSGSYFVHTHGKEYEGIPPVWHWQYLPGTTVEEVPRFNYPLVEFGYGAGGSHDFSGVLSDGETGVATMILTRQNIKECQKTIIALPGAVYFLGLTGDLSKVANNVHTTVNQCWHDEGLVRATMTGGKETHSIMSGELRRFDISEVRHDGLLYQFLLPADVTVELTTSRGTWKSINKGQSAEPVSGGTFSLWINHGKRSKDRYAYVIRKAGSAGAQCSFVCSEASQTITSVEKGMAAGAIFSAGAEIDLGDVKIKPKSPLAFIAHLEDSTLTLTISDPTQKLDSIEIHFEWINAKYDHVVNLPTELDFRGKGVTVVFTAKGVRA
ncbi:polysaccharide lyase family 8 super-sandwich domain-containing protein [Pseudomonas sp. FYR_11]|uniref:polysaccharide lyase family 8 super-sandwich domain-containing protein n=1 Tax=Pseudomonas TaxID=286 RepID=UPI00370A6B2D